VEIILPVITHADRERQIVTRLPVILHVGGDLLLEQRQPSVPLLLAERVRLAGLIRRETVEIERAAKIGPVVESTLAPVGSWKPAWTV
jgi:hypothetical protein